MNKQRFWMIVAGAVVLVALTLVVFGTYRFTPPAGASLPVSAGSASNSGYRDAGASQPALTQPDVWRDAGASSVSTGVTSRSVAGWRDAGAGEVPAASSR